MLGRTTIMELRTGWKGFLIFAFIILITASGVARMFPTFRDSMQADLNEANPVFLVLPDAAGGDIQLSWQPVNGSAGYLVLEDNTSLLASPAIKYTGLDNKTSFPHDFDETRYYAVMSLPNGTGDPVFVGMASTSTESDNPFQDLMEEPAYAAFTGGRSDFDIFSVKGFLSLEFFSWFWMLAGFFFAYISVSVVASDFEGKRMDILFSTPLSRTRYLVEKYAALAIVATFILLLAGAALAGSINSIGEGANLPAGTIMAAMVACIPFLLVIASVGMLTAVAFKRTRTGMGLTFVFILTQFIFLTVAGFSDNWDGLKYLSIMHYWDYNSILFDGVFNYGYFFGLLALAIAIFAGAVLLFNKRDIPA